MDKNSGAYGYITVPYIYHVSEIKLKVMILFVYIQNAFLL